MVGAVLVGGGVVSEHTDAIKAVTEALRAALDSSVGKQPTPAEMVRVVMRTIREDREDVIAAAVASARMEGELLMYDYTPRPVITVNSRMPEDAHEMFKRELKAMLEDDMDLTVRQAQEVRTMDAEGSGEVGKPTIDEALERVRRLDAKATPGPWSLWCMDVMYSPDGSSDADTAVTVASTHYLNADGRPRTNDAEFIAEARTLLPLLAAEVERLRWMAKGGPDV